MSRCSSLRGSKGAFPVMKLLVPSQSLNLNLGFSSLKVSVIVSVSRAGMKAPSSYLCLPQTLRGSETEAVNGTQTHSLHAISSVLQLLHWQLFSLYTAAGFQTAFQKQRCDLISSPLNLSALLIEPLSLHKRELFQVFPLDAAS